MSTASAVPENSSEAQRYPWLVRLLPSLTDVAFLFPVLFLFARLDGVKTLLGDGDTGWHVRTGEWILRNARVPVADMFSFSKPGQPWFAWEWAWDAAFALVHQCGGMAAVVGVNILLLCLTSALLFRLIRRSCPNDVLAIALTTLAMSGSSIHWLARPHLLSWAFLLLFCHAVQSAREGNLRALWWLPGLTLVWTNVHGSFFVGIAFLIAIAAGRIIEQFLFPVESIRPAAWKPFLLCAAACGLASFVNPYGLELHRHVISYLLDAKQLENIGEYQSISFHSGAATYFELVLLLGLVCVGWCFRTRRFADAMWLTLWTHLALQSARNIPLYLFFAMPVIASMLQTLAAVDLAVSVSAPLRKWGAAFADLGSDFRILERVPRLHLLSLATAAGLAFLLCFPAESAKLRAEYDPHSYPAGAVRFVQSQAISNIFTDDEWGDYVIYQLFPHCRVYVDGRSDFYGADFADRYVKIRDARYDWQANLARIPLDAVLLRVDSPLASVLKQSPRWKFLYDDGVAILFVPIVPAGVPASISNSGEKISSASPGGRKGSATPSRGRLATPAFATQITQRKSS